MNYFECRTAVFFSCLGFFSRLCFQRVLGFKRDLVIKRKPADDKVFLFNLKNRDGLVFLVLNFYLSTGFCIKSRLHLS
jgi:hypothetical protein